MFRDLFINACVIISYIFLLSRFISNPLSGRKVNMWFAGFLAGLLGLILMMFSITISPNVLVDLRHLAIIIPAVYLGVLPTVIAAMIIAMGRLAFFGVSVNSIEVAFVMLILGIGCALISRAARRLPVLQRMTVMTIFCMIMISLLLMDLLAYDFSILPKIFSYHWLFSFLTMYLVYYTIDYVMKNNAMIRRLKAESTTDFLTGLNNPRQFEALFHGYISKAKRQQKSVSILLIDIDHFKQVNDTFGHEAGDAVLKELGQLLLRATRLGDTVSRNGGEEFSAVLLDRSKRQALGIAERIRQTIETHEFTLPNRHRITITVSIGVAAYPETTEDADELFRKADAALYEAKHRGRNQVMAS
jgi:diguanylate cyclase